MRVHGASTCDVDEQVLAVGLDAGQPLTVHRLSGKPSLW
jgi:hypothetical protein